MAISSTFLQTLGPEPATNYYYNAVNMTMDKVGLRLASSWPVGTPMLVAFQLKPYNSKRGQMYVNDELIFDSYARGAGDYRFAAGWGVGYSVASTKPEYVSEFLFHGAGDLGIRTDTLKFTYVRLHGIK